MKTKYLVLATALLVGSLFSAVGCSSNEAEKGESFEPVKQVEQKLTGKPNTSELKVVGDKLDSEYTGRGELKQIANVNKEINYDPIKIKIKDVKIIYIDELGQGVKDTLTTIVEAFGQKVDEKDKKKKVSYPVIEVEYEVENMTDKKINFGLFDAIVLNTGEQIDTMLSINEPSGNDLSNDFYGRVKFNGKMTYPIQSDPKDIKNAKLIFGSVVDNKTYDTLNENGMLEVVFK